MEFDNIRKALGFLGTIEFNLEHGGRKSLKGMVTDAMLAAKKVFGPAWHKRPEAEKDEIVRCLLDPKCDDETIRSSVLDVWGLDDKAAEALLDLDLPSGHLHLSLTALAKLAPHMERGLLYRTDDDRPSALSEAGYLRPDQAKRRVHDRLPDPPDLTNPIVRQAVFEVRKVVNAIIREYGKRSFFIACMSVTDPSL